MSEDKEKDPFKKNFTVNKGENYNKIQSILQDLNNVSISNHNQQKWFDKVMSQSDLIMIRIDEETDDYISQQKKRDEEMSSERTEEAIRNGLVPIKLFEAVAEMLMRTKSIISWKTIETELFKQLSIRLNESLAQTKAIDIKTEALKEMRELDKNKSDLEMKRTQMMIDVFKDGMSHMINNFTLEIKDNNSIIVGTVNKLSNNYIDLLKYLVENNILSSKTAKSLVDKNDLIVTKRELPKFSQEEKVVKKSKPKVVEKEVDEDDEDNDSSVDDDESFLEAFQKSRQKDNMEDNENDD